VHVSHDDDTSAPAPDTHDLTQAPTAPMIALDPPLVAPPVVHLYNTRLRNNIVQPKQRTVGMVTYSVVRSSDSEPTSHVSALKDPLRRQSNGY
jgi:hypothetical protein